MKQWKTAIIGLVALLITAHYSLGFYQSDEHFQILEFAALKLGLTEVAALPWEYEAKMRPALQPLIAFGVHKFLGGNPWTVSFALRGLTALFYWFLVWGLARYVAKSFPERLLPLLFFFFFLHYAALYSGVRFSSESWSGLSVALAYLCYVRLNGISWAMQPADLAAFASAKNSAALSTRYWALAYLGIGFLFGLSFLFRYQVGLLLLGFGLWLLFVKKETLLRLGLLLLGGSLALTLGVLADHWLYGEWVFAPWNYLRVNVLQGKAAEFGSEPWWYYFSAVFTRGIPPLSIVYILLPLFFFYRYPKHPITWMWIPFLLAHFYLERKDVRFLFPLLPLLPLLVFNPITTAWLQDQLFAQKNRFVRSSLKILVFINLLVLLAIMFKPAVTELRVAKYLYTQHPQPIPMWMPAKDPWKIIQYEMRYYQHSDGWPNRIQAPSPRTYLLIEKTTKPSPAASSCKLLYHDLPAWVRHLDKFNWLEKTAWWHVYQCLGAQ